MQLKTLTQVTLLALAFAMACFGQGSVFSLDGGSQVQYFTLPANALTDSSINVTNSAFLNTAAPPTAPNGNICVNLYEVDPAANMVACCSCLVKPNQTVNIKPFREIGFPVPLTTKLLATPAAVGGPTTCNPSTIVQPSVIPFGMAAWKKIQQGPTSDGMSLIAETAFTPYIMGPQEVAQLTSQCAASGGFKPLCSSCLAGGQ
jgi:hypothetical protein